MASADSGQLLPPESDRLVGAARLKAVCRHDTEASPSLHLVQQYSNQYRTNLRAMQCSVRTLQAPWKTIDASSTAPKGPLQSCRHKLMRLMHSPA